MRGGIRAFVTLAIVIVTAAQGWTAARTEPFRKLDWRAIAQSLRKHVRPGDVILAAEPWSDISLRYYLGEIPNVKLVYMAGVGIAEILRNDAIARGKAAWMVSAGNSGDASVRTWICRDPLVLASSLENFRLHYAPSRADLFQHRSTAAEQRAVATAIGDAFTMRMEDELFLGEGWANLEGSGEETFRWAIGKRATIVIPQRARRDHVIRFHAYPLAPQNVRITLNDREVGVLALRDAWREYAIAAPAALWREGLNTIAFEFEKAAVPSANDARELAASFRWIALDDGPRIGAVTVRIDADSFLDAAAGRRRASRRDAGVTGRLGFDPLSNGDVPMDDLAGSIAAGSDCEGDEAFLERAFAILVRHPPDAIARADLLRRMREGATRKQIVARIVKSLPQ